MPISTSFCPVTRPYLTKTCTTHSHAPQARWSEKCSRHPNLLKFQADRPNWGCAESRAVGQKCAENHDFLPNFDGFLSSSMRPNARHILGPLALALWRRCQVALTTLLMLYHRSWCRYHHFCAVYARNMETTPL